ncbi:MAG: betaine/proline/choline family ABC transporter ATP-binding protein [Cyanobacteria bacterium P01_F01_bin.42]
MHSVTAPKIRIENLVQIYGDNPRTALAMFRNGNDRATILKATGHVVGVANVSFTIGCGELFVIMGLSGSGKSTLLRCINRLIKPISGHIYIGDREIVHLPLEQMRQMRARSVSMVFQNFALFPHQTVLENVAYGLKIQGVKKHQRHQQAAEMLRAVGLADRASSLPVTLSGGMQQRVGLARALATGADILLMDEPFSALDPLIRREMQDELLRLQGELHKTIVFISHDIHEAIRLGDRIAVMRDGEIVQMGTPTDLIQRPANDYIRAFTRDVRES